MGRFNEDAPETRTEVVERIAARRNREHAALRTRSISRKERQTVYDRAGTAVMVAALLLLKSEEEAEVFLAARGACSPGNVIQGRSGIPLASSWDAPGHGALLAEVTGRPVAIVNEEGVHAVLSADGRGAVLEDGSTEFIGYGWALHEAG